MSNPIARPAFYDGQILNATDLSNSVGYGRDQMARHERYLHSWGISSGFDLIPGEVTGASYKTVTVSPGSGFDGRGREFVLTGPQVLDPTDFIGAHVFDPSILDPWYPVYAYGTNGTSTPQVALGICAGSKPTAQGEGVKFDFGPPSPMNNSTTPYAPIGPGDPTDSPRNVSPWRVLIGFVKWDASSGQFADAQAHNDAGVSRRLAGVQAARIEARDGTLTLQTSPNPASRMMLVVQEGAGDVPGSLTFGADNGHGGVTSLFSVTAKGDLTVAGKISSATPLAPGTISVQSGIATDGMTLPLPAGVKDDDVQKKLVTLHMQVTSILPEAPPQPTTVSATDPIVVIVPLGCHVDESRRVRCRLRYLYFGSGLLTPVDVAGRCHYTIVATPAAATGGISS